jgi:ABC-2 type transport system ATP-binding protein
MFRSEAAHNGGESARLTGHLVTYHRSRRCVVCSFGPGQYRPGVNAVGLPTLTGVAAVEVERLAKRYSDVVAVADVSLTAQPGQVTAVLGPNGAGKTTTVEICAGLRAADSGTIRVLGLDPRRDGDRLHPRVGMMPQAGSAGSGVYPSARTGEVLKLHAALHSTPQPVDALVERLGLGKVIGTPWRRLSGGEQQRLSLALAIVGRPEVVFLDEPSAGLDVTGRHATWQLIRDLRGVGVTVLLTTHALDEAEQLADHVVIVDAGRVVASGTPAELTRTHDDRREIRFEATPGLPLDDLLRALPAGMRASEQPAGHYLLSGSVSPEVVAAVTSWCAARGVMADRLTTGSRSLEQVFLDLTGGGAAP